MTLRWYIIPALFVFAACEKEIPLDQEETQPRIVVNGLFSAGDTIQIHISESRDILYEGELPNLTGATAQLLNSDNALLGTFQHQSDGNYILTNYIPQAGNTYKIVVTNSGFDDIEGTTTAPAIIGVNSIDTLRKGDRMTYEIKFNDDASVTNYYALTISKISIYEDEFTGEIYVNEDPYFSTTEIFTQNGSADVDGSKWGDIFLFSDASFNGQVCSFSAENEIYPEEDSVFVVVGLRSVSEDYYKYSISLSKYQQTQGDPFAQPVQVYSNIEKGYGIFGAYSVYSDTLLIE